MLPFRLKILLQIYFFSKQAHKCWKFIAGSRKYIYRVPRPTLSITSAIHFTINLFTIYLDTALLEPIQRILAKKYVAPTRLVCVGDIYLKFNFVTGSPSVGGKPVYKAGFNGFIVIIYLNNIFTVTYCKCEQKVRVLRETHDKNK